MIKLLILLIGSIAIHSLIASKPEPKKAAKVSKASAFKPILTPTPENNKIKEAALPEPAETAYQLYCIERRKLANPNILTRAQFMNPNFAQK